MDQFPDRPVCDTLIHLFSIVKRNQIGKHLFFSQLFQRTAKFRLKDDQHTGDCNHTQLLTDPQDRIHPQNCCNNQKNTDKHDTF